MPISYAFPAPSFPANPVGQVHEAVPLAYAEKAAELYENCELAIIPEANHGYEGYYEQLTDAIEDFLRELK